MSTRLRYIGKLNGTYFCGSQVKQLLKQATMNILLPAVYNQKLETLEDMQKAAKLMGMTLWVFKEPRGTPASKSRYKRTCSWMGIGHYYKKPKPPHQFNIDALYDEPPALGHLQQVLKKAKAAHDGANKVGGQARAALRNAWRAFGL